MEKQIKLLQEIREQLCNCFTNFYLCNIYADIRGIKVHSKDWNKRYQLLQEEIPLFTSENAIPFNTWSCVGPEDSWWNGNNRIDRLAFIDWLIEQYSQTK